MAYSSTPGCYIARNISPIRLMPSQELVAPHDLGSGTTLKPDTREGDKERVRVRKRVNLYILSTLRM